LIQEAAMSPQFKVITGGGVAPTNSQGNPCNAGYIHANGDLTIDLRSDIAAESRAKIVYEYLMQFTDDPYVNESLWFLMTLEVAEALQRNAQEVRAELDDAVARGQARRVDGPAAQRVDLYEVARHDAAPR
jgi:manganese catalase